MARQVAKGKIIVLSGMVLVLSAGLAHAKVRSLKNQDPEPVIEQKVVDSQRAFDLTAVIEQFSQDAATRIHRLKDKIPSDAYRDALSLTLATHALQKNDPETAIAHLLSAPKTSVLKDYLILLAGRAYLDLKKPDKVLLAIPQQQTFGRKLNRELFWLRQEALADLKRTAELTTEIAAMRKKSSRDPQTDARAEFTLGRAALLRGDKKVAAEAFRRVLVDHAGSEMDDAVLKEILRGMPLKQVLSEVDLNRRCERLIDNGFPHLAVTIYQQLLSVGTGEKKKFYQERFAYATFRNRDYKKAAQLYETTLKSGNHTSPREEILEKIAQAHARHDNFAAAIATNKHIVKNYPGTEAAKIADFKLGFLLFDSGQYPLASQYFQKYLVHGSPKQREQARWYRWWGYYLSHDFEHAQEEITALSAHTRDGKERRMLKYWLARLKHKSGQAAQAKALYQEIARASPADYYGLLARQRLRSGTLHPRTLIDPELIDFAPEGQSGAGAEPDCSQIPQDDPLFTAILLSRAGLDEYAYDESLLSRLSAGPGSYNLMLCFQDGANCVKGYTLHKAALGGGLGPGGELAAYRLGYPLAFQKYIGTYARIWSVDEVLPYAVMRQESTFKPLALSSAYAYGLMQIIPPTADQIADQMGFPGFHIGLLNTPRVNTLFGTYYLGTLADKFAGKLIHTIAAYNAGPNAVARWQGKSGKLQDDEFVELIPYQETKDYVKKVMLNYLIYKKIY